MHIPKATTRWRKRNVRKFRRTSCYFAGVFSFLRAAQRARAASDIFLRAAAEIVRFAITVTDRAFLLLFFAGTPSTPSKLPSTERASSTRANSLQSRICSASTDLLLR